MVVGGGNANREKTRTEFGFAFNLLFVTLIDFVSHCEYELVNLLEKIAYLDIAFARSGSIIKQKC